MVLLVEPVRRAGGHHDAVDALAQFGIALALRHEIAAGALVARRPGLAAVRRVEHAGRRDADPELPGLTRVRDDGMQDQPAAARLPLGDRKSTRLNYSH